MWFLKASTLISMEVAITYKKEKRISLISLWEKKLHLAWSICKNHCKNVLILFEEGENYPFSYYLTQNSPNTNTGIGKWYWAHKKWKENWKLYYNLWNRKGTTSVSF